MCNLLWVRRSQIEDLKRVVHSLTRPGAESGDSGGFGLYSLLGLGSSSSNKVVKTITGGGDEEADSERKWT